MATKSAVKKGAKSKTKIEPLGDHVLVKRVEAETTTKGGIVLPETAKEKPREGVVVAVGPGRLQDDGSRTEPQVSPKDRVIFSSYAGSEVTYEGTDYLIVREDEILAIVN